MSERRTQFETMMINILGDSPGPLTLSFDEIARLRRAIAAEDKVKAAVVEPDILNKFMVGVQGDEIVFALRPLPSRLSKADALLAAAYLLALADEGDGQFDVLLTAVRNLMSASLVSELSAEWDRKADRAFDLRDRDSDAFKRNRLEAEGNALRNCASELREANVRSRPPRNKLFRVQFDGGIR